MSIYHVVMLPTPPTVAQFSDVAVKPEEIDRVYGGLKDQDRIFTNLYGDTESYKLEHALKRVNIYLYIYIKGILVIVILFKNNKKFDVL